MLPAIKIRQIETEKIHKPKFDY